MFTHVQLLGPNVLSASTLHRGEGLDAVFDGEVLLILIRRGVLQELISASFRWEVEGDGSHVHKPNGPVVNFQSLMLPSSLAVAYSLPSGANEHAQTGP